MPSTNPAHPRPGLVHICLTSPSTWGISPTLEVSAPRDPEGLCRGQGFSMKLLAKSTYQRCWVPGCFLGEHSLQVNYKLSTKKWCLTIGIGANVWGFITWQCEIIWNPNIREPQQRVDVEASNVFLIDGTPTQSCACKSQSVWYTIQRAFGELRPWPSMHPKILVQALGKENCYSSSTNALTSIDIYEYWRVILSI